ncbi:DUF5623 domain-containing protein [Chitinilyticum aquatile]|uniref:DUF5623 domain-containing protein n=1 Tax=Chitinilyticum aquatile TaxID=362520 RepID=UPI00048D4B2B|nr:DUF5623 domain-containing protein [Chitinilyticum aquatile]
MNTASIRPSTVDGIKQLAKKIRRERNITHTIALDEASRQAGFENFVHARRQLEQPLYPVYLTVHWTLPQSEPGELRAGREIWRIDLNRPLPDIIAKHRVRAARGLAGFRMEYEDHLEHRTDTKGQDLARQVLLSAARALRFIEVTGLQPVSTQKHRDCLRQLARVPGRDHQSQWFDPLTGACLMLDEPYENLVRHVAEDRQRWLDHHQFKEASLAWEGIHRPGECSPRMLGDDADLLQRIAVRVAKLKPISMPAIWPHETSPYGDEFTSPKRQADANPRRPRPGPIQHPRKHTVPYGGAPGIPSEWRPKKAMPFELHQQLGPLMHSLSSGFTSRVTTKLRRVHTKLEDWVILEHKHEHPDAVYDVYFGPQKSSLCSTDNERLVALIKARTIVVQGYDNCVPRRELLAALDAGIAEVEKYLYQNQ